MILKFIYLIYFAILEIDNTIIKIK